MTNKQFLLPSKPSIKLKEQAPDARHYAVLPIRCINDKRLTRGDYVNLIALCSYCSNNGFTTVAHSTIAKYRGVSAPAISKGLKRLEKLGYMQQVRAGYQGLRGSLKRVIFDASLSIRDVIAISNTPIERDYPMGRKNKHLNQAPNQPKVSSSPLTFDDAVLVVGHSLKTEADLLKLTKLVEAGISRAELLSAFSVDNSVDKPV
jgi:hypothetical protein